MMLMMMMMLVTAIFRTYLCTTDPDTASRQSKGQGRILLCKPKPKPPDPIHSGGLPPMASQPLLSIASSESPLRKASKPRRRHAHEELGSA
ncbi:hypothetical protein M434DRAFT_140049 [Hypoxylon sp. CO27-5]|nr:hypothetical protein M434DRAFT_140049 [Hypoxylon sp. CO27-5]